MRSKNQAAVLSFSLNKSVDFFLAQVHEWNYCGTGRGDGEAILGTADFGNDVT